MTIKTNGEYNYLSLVSIGNIKKNKSTDNSSSIYERDSHANYSQMINCVYDYDSRRLHKRFLDCDLAVLFRKILSSIQQQCLIRTCLKTELQ